MYPVVFVPGATFIKHSSFLIYNFHPSSCIHHLPSDPNIQPYDRWEATRRRLRGIVTRAFRPQDWIGQLSQLHGMPGMPTKYSRWGWNIFPPLLPTLESKKKKHLMALESPNFLLHCCKCSVTESGNANTLLAPRFPSGKR